MFFDPHPACYPDILARPLKSESVSTENTTMKHVNTDSDGFAIMTTLVLMLATFAALASCSAGSGAPAPAPVPTYQADEPNDTWHSANVIPSHEDHVYMVEGNIHHGDLDHIACNLPLPRNGDTLIDISVDYAAGWDMEVQIGWIDNVGAVTALWGGYDEAGLGSMSAQVMVPEDAGWLALTIRQSQYPAPGQTRYTFTVEVF